MAELMNFDIIVDDTKGVPRILHTKVQKLDEVTMITFNSTEIEFPALF